MGHVSSAILKESIVGNIEEIWLYDNETGEIYAKKRAKSQWRIWTDSTGAKTEATFRHSISGTVELIRRDGTVTKIPVEALSKEDQQWIKNPHRMSAEDVPVVKKAEGELKGEGSQNASVQVTELRTWTDASGKHTLKAKFSGIIAGTVKLIKQDGSTISIPLEKLSDEDKDWIKNHKR